MTTSNPNAAELNRQIAERLGWTINQCGPDEILIWKDSQEERGEVQRPWATDRNAIATDLLPRLEERQWLLFTGWLLANFGACDGTIGSVHRHTLTATPEQLCRAWLQAMEGERE